jgi:hypothetical protein
MHRFKDANGKEWSVILDVNMTRQIRTELGVDLHKLDKESVASLTSDDEKLVDVLSIICQEQIKNQNLDAAGFARCLIGGALDDACDALMEELVFISRRSRSQVVATAWEKTKAAETRMTTKAMELMESGMIEQNTDALLQKMEEEFGSLLKTAK